MKEITTNTTPVLDFDVLPTNTRLNVPVTIYRGIHPTPQKQITLGALFSEIVTDDFEKIAAARQLVEFYKKHLLEQNKDAKKGYEEKKSQ